MAAAMSDARTTGPAEGFATPDGVAGAGRTGEPSVDGNGDRPVDRTRGGDRWAAAAREFVAWRGGDRAALDRLVRLLTPLLWQLARAYGLERQAAEDVVQSTWLALVRHADGVRDPQAVSQWLTTTTRREAWKAGRAGSREAAVEAATLDAAAPPSAAPEQTVLATAQARTLWHHVAELSSRCQRLLRVIAFEDRPNYASLSVQLGMPVGGVGPTRRRCLDKLRDRLGDDPEWSDR